MLSIPVSEVGVMRSLLVLSGLLVFRRLFVVVGRTLMMMSRVIVIFPSPRHVASFAFSQVVDAIKTFRGKNGLVVKHDADK
jgi:hypothetical protein